MAEIEKIEDFDERVRAVVTPNHAFINASAGTGKTHTLTLRAIFLLLTMEAERLYDPSAVRGELQRAVRDSLRSLVLTTFTKKASAEMQDRVFSYLNRITRAGSRDELEEELKRNGDLLFVRVLEEVLKYVPGEDFALLQKGAQALVERAPELQITTLHSFANLLLAGYPVEAGIPLDARFESEDDPSGIDRESRLVDIWIRREVLEAGGEMADDLRRSLAVLSLDQLRLILKHCLLNEWLADQILEFTLTGRDTSLEPEDCLETLQAWCEAVLSGKGRLSKAKRIAEELLTLISGVREDVPGSWEGIALILEEHREYMFAEGENIIDPLLEAMGELHPVYFERMRESGLLYRSALNQSLEKDNPEAWHAFQRLARRFAEWGGQNLIRETGIVSFNDMISLAGSLLERHPGVKEREYSRLRAVLVDEFQDTDPDQLALLRNLLSRPPGSDHEVLGFFVGDAKQSIYRFRDADFVGVEEFQRNYQSMIGCSKPVERLRLRTSFRSDEGIIGHANYLFTSLLDLGRSDENLLPFRPPGGAVPEWREVDSGLDDQKADEKRAAVARAVLAAVREYMDGSPGPGDSGERSYRDILVLCRTYDELDPVIDVLKRAGLPVISSGCKTFQVNPEVVDTVNLLIALLDPLDSLGVGSTLKSPIVGLGDPEVYRFFREADPVAVLTGREAVPGFIEGRARARIKAIVRSAVKLKEGELPNTTGTDTEFDSDSIVELVEDEESGILSGSMDLDDWIRMAGRLVPAEAYHREWDLEGISYARIKKVLEDFRNICLEGAVPPLAWLLEEREKAVHKPRPDEGFSEDVSLADESVRAIRVMTMHKAKGLEGKFVIIASWSSLLESGLGLSRRGRRKTVYDFPGYDGNRVRAFCFKWGRLNLKSFNYHEAAQLDREMDSREAKRVAYVSATRPRERLMMITPAGFIPEKASELLQVVEEYKKDACARGLLVASSREEEAEKNALLPQERIRGIDPETYWKVWKTRYEAFMEACPASEKKPSPAPELVPRVGHPGVEEDKAEPVGLEGVFGPASREIGTLVHFYLEQHLLDESLDRNELEAMASMMESGYPGPGAVGRAGSILKRFFSGQTIDSQGRPLRDRVRDATVMAREFPVMVEYGGEVQHRVIDLLMQENRGITIIDFKTGGKPPVLPERYRIQREVYTEAVRRLAPGRTVKFEFWWL